MSEQGSVLHGTQRQCGAVPDTQGRYGVYVLVNTLDRRTYVGCTNNFARRIRQHCGIIAGGAKATRGCASWRFYVVVTGFASRNMALSFEWYAKRYKHFPGGYAGGMRATGAGGPGARRMQQIQMLLEKFGSCRFPELTVHPLAAPS